MSIQAVAWVLEHSEATYADRLVLIAIANHIGPTGWAYPSVNTIASEARVDRSTVYRCIQNLVDSGELSAIKRPGKASLYGISAMHQGSQIETPKGSHLRAQGVASRNKPMGEMRPEPSEPSRTAPPLPPKLDGATRERGAAFMRSLRKREVGADTTGAGPRTHHLNGR